MQTNHGLNPDSIRTQHFFVRAPERMVFEPRVVFAKGKSGCPARKSAVKDVSSFLAVSVEEAVGRDGTPQFALRVGGAEWAGAPPA